MAAYGYDEFNVRGDGNCFYRSIYNAALHHKDPTIFGRLLECLGMPAGISENDFVIAVRQVIVRLINNGLYNHIHTAERAIAVAEAASDRAKKQARAATYHPLRRLHEAAIMAATPAATPAQSIENTNLWNAFLEEMSFEMQAVIRDIGGYETLARLTSDQAVDLLTRIISHVIIHSGVYASESDISILRHILEICRITIRVPNPDYGMEMPDTVRNPLGREFVPLYLRRVGQIHYHFFAPRPAPAAGGGGGGAAAALELSRYSPEPAAAPAPAAAPEPARPPKPSNALQNRIAEILAKRKNIATLSDKAFNELLAQAEVAAIEELAAAEDRAYQIEVGSEFAKIMRAKGPMTNAAYEKAEKNAKAEAERIVKAKAAAANSNASQLANQLASLGLSKEYEAQAAALKAFEEAKAAKSAKPPTIFANPLHKSNPNMNALVAQTARLNVNNTTEYGFAKPLTDAQIAAIQLPVGYTIVTMPSPRNTTKKFVFFKDSTGKLHKTLPRRGGRRRHTRRHLRRGK